MARQQYEYGSGKARSRMQERADGSILNRIATIGPSAALGGGILGAGISLLSSARNPRDLLKAALLGGGASAAIATGANIAGTPFAGEEDSTVDTRRGAIGGALLGGAAGGGAGYLATAPKVGGVAAPVQETIKGLVPPKSTMLGRTTRALSKSPWGRIGATALGSLLGAGVGSYQGADEGMQYDVIRNELQRLRERQ